jgi:hypothetical protein
VASSSHAINIALVSIAFVFELGSNNPLIGDACDRCTFFTPRWPRAIAGALDFGVSMESTTEQQPSNGFQAFLIYWRGNGKLGTAYWGFGFAGTLILYFLAMLGLLFIAPFVHESDTSVFESTVFRVYLAIVFLVLLGYQIMVWVLVWRNAHNTSNPFWSQLAKAAVAVSAVAFLYQAIKQI